MVTVRNDIESNGVSKEKEANVKLPAKPAKFKAPEKSSNCVGIVALTVVTLVVILVGSVFFYERLLSTAAHKYGIPSSTTPTTEAVLSSTTATEPTEARSSSKAPSTTTTTEAEPTTVSPTTTGVPPIWVWVSQEDVSDYRSSSESHQESSEEFYVDSSAEHKASTAKPNEDCEMCSGSGSGQDDEDDQPGPDDELENGASGSGLGNPFYFRKDRKWTH